MKKFFSFFIASAVAASAFAADSVTPSLHADFIPKVDMFKFNPALNAFKPQKVSRPVKGKYQRFDDTRGASPLEGTWTFVIGDNYFTGSKGYVDQEFVATIDENNIVTFTSTSNEFYKLIARYNPKTHSLTFTKRQVATADGNYVFQDPFVYNWEDGTITRRTVLAYYSEYEDAIVFNDNLGIALSAYADAAAKDFRGYYDMLDMAVCYHPVGGEWTALGEASFTDGWLAPGFGEAGANNTYLVEIEQNKDNQNLYRLVNPYKRGPLAATNECEEDGYIVFDVSDPDHVIFKFANAGYVNKEKGCTMFFVYNYFGTLVLINPYYTPEEILQEVGDEYPFTIFKDGALVFDNSGTLPDTRFGLQYPPTFGYYWKDNDGKPATANMTGAIVLPSGEETGINAFNADEADAVYYNVQGLRVVNPEPGQILIKRVGNKITKVIKP